MSHPMKYHSEKVSSKLSDPLEKFNLYECPYLTFARWYKSSSITEPNVDAMSVATVDKNGIPRNRYILFKGIVDSKIVFFTNYLSQKSQDLENNPHISLNFFWPSTKYQVRITGLASKCPRDLNEQYFASRDRDSQFASAISHQSSPIENRDVLVKKVEELKKSIGEEKIVCPENWGGFSVDPFEFEFFIYGAYRLNDRFLFVKNEKSWELSRLQP